MRYIITASSPDVELPLGVSDSEAFFLPLIEGMVSQLEDSEVTDLRAKGFLVEPEGEYFIPKPRTPVVTSDVDSYPSMELDPKLIGTMNMMERTGVERILSNGISGKGAHIGYVDSGVWEEHPDIKGRMLNFHDFTSDASTEPIDPAGHGTACVGFSCGTGLIVSKFHGVAPGAQYSMARVMDADGRGSSSDIILGLQWLDEIGCDIINVSIGSMLRRYDALSAACDSLARKGRIVCIAAGNDGPLTITSPANAYGGITCAACDQNGHHSGFSSIGPALGMDREELAKPDVMAWGEHCALCRARGSYMGLPIHDMYVAADGTSFATPFVAGLAALYKEVKGDLSAFITDITANCEDNVDYTHHQEGFGIATIGFLRKDGDPPVGPPITPPTGGCLLAGISPIIRLFR